MNTLPKPDAIFISMPPLSTVDLVTRWGKKNDVPVVVDIIDPWPDSFIKDVPLRVKNHVKELIFPFYRKLKRSFHNSAAITAISEGYLKWATEYHIKTKPTACFYLAIDYQEIQKIYKKYEKFNIEKDTSKLRLIYAGSLASSYDIPSIIEAAKILHKRHPNRTEFIITGNGPQKDIIIEAVKEVTNINYLGFVSKEELLKQYYLADIGLIQHKNSLTQTITYKFFNYLSADLVLLNSLQTEMADIIEKEKLGLNNLEEDVDTLVSNIEFFIKNNNLLTEYKSNANKYVSRKGDSTVVYNELVEFIEKLVK